MRAARHPHRRLPSGAPAYRARGRRNGAAGSRFRGNDEGKRALARGRFAPQKFAYAKAAPAARRAIIPAFSHKWFAGQPLGARASRPQRPR